MFILKYWVSVLFIVLIGFVFNGCSAGQLVKPLGKELVSSDEVFKKSYSLNKKYKVYIGNPLLKVENYQVDIYNTSKVIPTESFTISSIAPLINKETIQDSFTKDDKLDLIGSFVNPNDNLSYQIVNVPTTLPFKFGMLIRDGKIYKNYVFGNNNTFDMPTLYELKHTPSDVRLIPITETLVNTSQGMLNFEIIYNGIDNNTLNLIYREYTPENLARVAFFQTLKYDLKEKTIRFRDILIKLHNVNNEEIEFTILEDGLRTNK